jgi:hypothetical protein
MVEAARLGPQRLKPLRFIGTAEAVPFRRDHAVAGRCKSGGAACAKAASSPSRKALRVNRRTPNYAAG